MKEKLSAQMERMKTEMAQEIERYYGELSQGSEDPTCKINDFERMMVKHRKRTDEILLRAANEALSNVEEAEGKKCPKCKEKLRRIRKGQAIGIKTLCGEVEIKRDYYYCRHCGYGETPLDARLGIDEMKHGLTDEMRVEAAFYGQNQSSFDAAQKMVKKIYGMGISGETIRQITEEIGRAVFEVDAEKARETLENMDKINMADDNDKQEKTLYVMTDGAAVNTRVEDENGSTWRENKTVIAFTDRDMIKRKDGSHIIVQKEYSALIGSAEEFKGFVLNTALKSGYGQIKEVVVIADGAAWIRNMCGEIFPEATQILDLYHLKENIYTYAKERFNQDEKKYAPWAERVTFLIENGETDRALDEIPEDAGGQLKSVNLKTYLKNNRDKINYPEYRKRGWFVGSGAIESANKTIVQRRLKQAGMRWSVSGAQALLSLRCKVESELWDSEVHDLVCA